MKLNENVVRFFKTAGRDNLCFTEIPALCAIILAENIFESDFWYGMLIFIACLLFQMSAQIFDDFFDWITSKTTKRQELEQTGVRGVYTKSSHFLTDKSLPRIYFFMALLITIIALLIFAFVSISSKKFLILLFLIPLPLFFLFNYHSRFRKIMNFIGTEFLCAILCSFITIFCVFYTCAKCVTLPVIFIGLLSFFFTYNLLYTASLLNLKPDIMTEKTTMPIILKGANKQLAFSIFLTLFPFILLPLGVYYGILPKISLISELLIFHSIWFLYLIYLFIKEPQKIIKWHFLMGPGKDEIENEQSSLGWYTVRYNFLENIYLIFFLVIILSIINWKEIFIY